MNTTEGPTREPVTTSSAPEDQLTALLAQPAEVQVRRLVKLCRQLSQQYQKAPQTCLELSWWRLFNEAGIQLHAALDQAKAEGYAGLSDQEVEQAYFLLIHVAYFFAPGSLAESLWPLLPAEPGDQQAKPRTSEAFGVTFGTPACVRQRTGIGQRVRRYFQRLTQTLGRSDRHDREAVQLLELPRHGPFSPDEECSATASCGKEAP